MHPHAIPPAQTAGNIRRRLVVSSDDDSEPDEDPIEKFNRELWLLRSTVAFRDVKGCYPFVSAKAREDFCDNWVDESEDDYCEENYYLKKKYDARRRSRFQDLKPREQEALQMGDKIWRSRHTRSRAEPDPVQEQDQNPPIVPEEDPTMLSDDSLDSLFSEDSREPKPAAQCRDKGKAVMVEREILDEFPLLKDTFRFGTTKKPDDKKIPGASDDGGSEKNTKKWKTMRKKRQIQELNTYVRRISLIRRQALLFLSQAEIK